MLPHNTNYIKSYCLNYEPPELNDLFKVTYIYVGAWAADGNQIKYRSTVEIRLWWKQRDSDSRTITMGRKPLVAGFNMYPGICCSLLFGSPLSLGWPEINENWKLIFIALIMFSDCLGKSICFFSPRIKEQSRNFLEMTFIFSYPHNLCHQVEIKIRFSCVYSETLVALVETLWH